LEKFSHLEDKIYRTVELCKSLKRDKEMLGLELDKARQKINDLMAENLRLGEQSERLIEDREALRLKVEAMLDAIAMLEMEAESLKK